MITCDWLRMARVAIWVSCTDCIIHSLATTFNTMRSLNSTMKGVASMDNTMAASTGLIHSGAMSE